MRLELSTGFIVEVTPFPPFALDALREKYREPEPYMRPVELASGAIEKVPYMPPSTPPGPENEEEYHLWAGYQMHQLQAQERRIKLYEERIAFLLSKCVRVIEGPSKMEDQEWQDLLLAREVTIPVNPIDKHVLWLCQVVIGTRMELDMITEKYSLYEEVVWQEVIEAVKAMEVEYQDTPLIDMMKLLENSGWEYNLRLTEMQLCIDMGKTPKQWYEMPRAERTMLVAAHLAPKWIENVDFKIRAPRVGK